MPRRLMVIWSFVFLLAACAPTTMQAHWRDPDFSRTTAGFTKVLALVVGGAPRQRREAEEDICDQVQRTTCKAAYWAIPQTMMHDVHAAQALVEKEGFDGAIVFRILGFPGPGGYVPPPANAGFWEQYGSGLTLTPGAFRESPYVVVEAAIYSVRHDKLLWLAATETNNPRSVDDLVKDVSTAVRKELQQEGIVPAQN
jgi:hypothetical protein